MILYNIVKEQIEARQSRRIEKIRAEGIAEGKAEGIAEGKSLAQQAWREWLQRKEAAEAANEPFDEPPPG